MAICNGSEIKIQEGIKLLENGIIIKVCKVLHGDCDICDIVRRFQSGPSPEKCL